MKILYLSSSLGSEDSGGRYLSLKILEVLKSKSEYQIIAVNTDKKESKEAKYNFINNRGFFSKLLNLFGPLSNGWYFDIVFKVINIIKKEKIQIVWFDSSMMGIICWLVKIKCPKVKAIVFYHNAEQVYYKEQSRFKKIGYFFYVKAIISELLMKKYCDGQVFLTEKDKNQCMSHKTENCIVTPIFYGNLSHFIGENILFIGSPNHFNMEAIDFIVKKIAPFVERKIVIVGISKENYGSNFIPINIEFCGWVEDLNKQYDECSLVIAPVFSGSGIKIKVGEAISKGKRVLASPHAANGYEDLTKTDALIVCTNASDYINEINNHNGFSLTIESHKSNMEIFSADKFMNKISSLINKIS